MVDTNKFYDYLNKNRISYTVDRNPSPEKIERIKKQIKKNLDLLKQNRISA